MHSSLNKNKKDIIEFILKEHVLRLTPLEPIRYENGNMGPFYMDMRLLFSYPKIRRLLVNEIANEINFLEFDVIAGVATGAIGWAALVAEVVNQPMVYVRKESKGYGSAKLVEGKLKNDQKVIIIEDVVFSGNSCYQACLNIQKEGSTPVACFAIMNCGTKVSQKTFKGINIPCYSLLNAADIANIALQINYLTKLEFDVTMDWINNPQKWSPSRVEKIKDTME